MTNVTAIQLCTYGLFILHSKFASSATFSDALASKYMHSSTGCGHCQSIGRALEN